MLTVELPGPRGDACLFHDVLEALCAGSLAGVMRPTRYLLWHAGALPRTHSGKLDRKSLAEKPVEVG